MTSHAQARCRTCHVRYFFQASGHGSPELNSGEWCPDCYQMYLDAFKSVPKRAKQVWVDTDEVTPLELEALENERAALAKAEGRLHARRVAAPLFDMTGSGNINRTGYTKKDGTLYRWSYWTKDPEDTSEVRKPMEKDLETGELSPWVDIRRR